MGLARSAHTLARPGKLAPRVMHWVAVRNNGMGHTHQLAAMHPRSAWPRDLWALVLIVLWRRDTHDARALLVACLLAAYHIGPDNYAHQLRPDMMFAGEEAYLRL